MGLTFEHPAWLLLGLLALPAGWVGVAWFSSMSRVRRWSAVVTRAVLIALVSAILAGASMVRSTDRLAVIGVIDVSESVRMFGKVGEGGTDPVLAAKQFLIAAQARRGPDDVIGVIAFDAKAVAVVMPTRGDVSDRSFEVRHSEGTDLAGAIRHAAAIIPPESAGRLVLFTDGIQTAGDALVAAREVGRGLGRSTPIDVVPVALLATREVVVESVDVPPRAAAGATIAVRIALRSTGPATGVLELTREGELVDLNGAEPGTGRRVTLREGRQVEVVSVPLPPGRLHRFEAVFTPDVETLVSGETRPISDTRSENNRAQGLTVSGGKGSVLLVDGVDVPGGPGGGGVLARTLREGDIEVTVVPPEATPSSLLELQAFDMVILENVPAESVAPLAQRALVAHVRDTGGGLVMVGGPDSLGAGGWKGSELEPILPVKLDLPERLVQPDAAVILIMDNSGSMGREVMGSVYSQQEIANQAAALAVKTLDKKDLVGVIVFNAATSVVVPLAQNSDSKATAERILAIGSGGGTVMGPALSEAGAQIGKVKAAVKHIIVLSDGRSAGFESLPAMAERIHVETGATISTISVGDAADEETMGAIADRGGGKSYIVNNPNLLPKFFLKAVRVIRTPLIRLGSFEPVIERAPSPLTAGLPSPPHLLGMVLSQRRPEATITYAMSAPGGEPLLASWNVELGKVGVFTSDASRWARDWIDWPGYRQMWTQTVRALSRAALNSPFELLVEPDGDSLRVRLEASNPDGKPVDAMTVPVAIYSPDGTQSTCALSQTGPGTYEARVRASESGAYIVVAKPTLNGQVMAGLIGGASVSSGVEYRRLTTNYPLLEAIAGESHGRVLSFGDGASADLFSRDGLAPRLARAPLWRVLLGWTILILLLDVGMRRVAWDRFVSREFGIDVKKAAAEAVADRGARAARAVNRLREAPKRTDTSGGSSPLTALTDVDAEGVVEAEQDRRRQDRLARVRALREQQAPRETSDEAGEAPAPVPAETPIPRAEPVGEPGSLLAAKRRARDRMDGGPES